MTTEQEDSAQVFPVRLRFSPTTYQLLQEAARRSGQTMPEALADAIGLQKTIQDARREGYRVLLERNGKYQELVPN